MQTSKSGKRDCGYQLELVNGDFQTAASRTQVGVWHELVEKVEMCPVLKAIYALSKTAPAVSCQTWCVAISIDQDLSNSTGKSVALAAYAMGVITPNDLKLTASRAGIQIVWKEVQEFVNTHNLKSEIVMQLARRFHRGSYIRWPISYVQAIDPDAAPYSRAAAYVASANHIAKIYSMTRESQKTANKVITRIYGQLKRCKNKSFVQETEKQEREQNLLLALHWILRWFGREIGKP